MNNQQATLSAPLSFHGPGLHTAKKNTITLLPAPVDHGIVFKRIDKKAVGTEIPANWQSTKTMPLCTCIVAKNGHHVRTIEHLMAAFYACGIDNIIVEVDGDEIPVLDGSAQPFIEKISHQGITKQQKPRSIFKITEKVEFTEDQRSISIEPADALYLDITITLVKFGCLYWSGKITPENFKEEMANARTFGRLKNGLLAKLTRFQKDPICLGANTNTAVVLVGNKAINKGGFRMQDELILHRALDLVGDLMLSGGHIHGKITAKSPAHRLNQGLLRKIFEGEKYK
ncbi:MAG: UDP-3-O-acyl-N-acetylglucosamine deacetylase [Cocleimonas sp.]